MHYSHYICVLGGYVCVYIIVQNLVSCLWIFFLQEYAPISKFKEKGRKRIYDTRKLDLFFSVEWSFVFNI